jgi:hypothetical protein
LREWKFCEADARMPAIDGSNCGHTSTPAAGSGLTPATPHSSEHPG